MLRITLLAVLLFGVSAVAADRSGEYEGTYASTDGDSAGKLRIVIQKNSDSTWRCQVFFTAGGGEVSTKQISCSADNDTIVTEFDAEVDGSTFHATLKGSAVDGKTFEGTYTTAGSGGDDQGKWKVSLRS